MAITLGVLAAALLIWRRRRKIRQHSFRGVSSMRMRASGTVPSDSVDLKLELDGKGEPVLLGQGSFAKVCRASCPTCRDALRLGWHEDLGLMR